MLTLVEAMADNGNSDAVSGGILATFDFPVKVEFIGFADDFDSGTFKLQQTPDEGTTWIDIGSGLSANGRELLELYHDGDLRVNASSVSAAGADFNGYLAGPFTGSTTVTDNS